ncbi:transcriptional regulator FtsR [Rothia santali]|uniref:transcriptional regulator FtsR n=1 Tax=Rothia santali TaxID=2949643 RepID=UPI0026650ACC|nr:MerR family transcriptional regulator [Rothia santali]
MTTPDRSAPSPAGPDVVPAAADAEGRDRKDKTIGQVLSHLDGDFPGLSASKIRFLEDRGLVYPQRTSTGYRKYSSADVERLRYILTLQRDHYLPLRVIKQKVDELEGAGSSAGPAAASDPEEVPPGFERSGTGRTYSMRDLANHTGVPLPTVRELIDYGLIAEGEQGQFDEHAARVASLCARLTSHGFEPRHLRFFRAAADREVGLVQQAVAPWASRRDEPSRERAAAAAREISGLCTDLHTALVREQVAKSW